jgi:hypothetical protein
MVGLADELYAKYKWEDCYAVTSKWVSSDLLCFLIPLSLREGPERPDPTFTHDIALNLTLDTGSYLVSRPTPRHCLCTSRACTISTASGLRSSCWRTIWSTKTPQRRRRGMPLACGTFPGNDGPKQGGTSGEPQFRSIAAILATWARAGY